MNGRIGHFIKISNWIAAILIAVVVFFLPGTCLGSYAETDPMIIVSMGDSYSSGEGLEPYFGQEKPLAKRIKDHDWLGHRSTISWPALLEVPGYPGTMADYKVSGNSTAACQWYFVASGGAVSSNIATTCQKIVINKVEYSDSGVTSYLNYPRFLPLQIDVFDKISGKVDYVTITIGGNDAGFGSFVQGCTKYSSYLGNATMDEMIKLRLKDVDTLKEQLKETYMAIMDAAGPQATVLAVGYPKLLDENGKGSLYTPQEAAYLNESIHELNSEMEKEINHLREKGLNIYFVDVEAAFEGHLAFSKDPWISGIVGTKPQELNDAAVISGSSLHPTAEGAKAYAKCVNAVIKELEKAKKTGSVSGKAGTIYGGGITTSSVEIALYDGDNNQVIKEKTDANGMFSFDIEEGTYKMVMSAPGYTNFSTYVTVRKGEEAYVEGILLYVGEVQEIGIINGKFLSTVTNTAVAKVDYTVREGWNNPTGPVVAVGRGGPVGYFTLELPVGCYTLTYGRSKYITETINITVEKGTKNKFYVYVTPQETSQNGNLPAIMNLDY